MARHLLSLGADPDAKESMAGFGMRGWEVRVQGLGLRVWEPLVSEGSGCLSSGFRARARTLLSRKECFGLAKGQRGMESGFVDNCCLAFIHETRTALRP